MPLTLLSLQFSINNNSAIICHIFSMEDKIGNLKSFLYATRVQTYQRVGHRAIQIGHNILVFGGTNGQDDFVTSILRINTQNITVDLILTKMQLKLSHFSLFTCREHIYLWGGNEPSGASNKLYRFVGEDFEVAPQSGQIPAARALHTSFFFSKKYLIIQGGTNGQQYFTDFYILDCHSMTWNQVNINISVPYALNTYLFWNGGRGFFILGETIDPSTKTINFENKIYEMRFTDAKMFKMSLELLKVTQTAERPVEKKHQPTIIFVSFESPYLMVIGGEIMPASESNPVNTYKDVWVFNLETLEWTSSNLKLQTVGFGSEAIFFQERLYLIGGVGLNYRDLVSTIEVIDINSDCLEAKLCKVCREMYGFKDYSGHTKQFTIKFQHESSQRTFFTVKTIAKMAKFLKHPFSAFGLLIDNSINLNGTIINLQFRFFDPNKPETSASSNKFLDASQFYQKMDEKIKMRYNYILITDDTSGFTQSEIVECLCSFGLKSQKLTTDKKYEEQLEIRKEYGINIKLGALRIAQSCLIVTKTEDDTIFVCYFTTLSQKIGDRFQIVHYFISQRDGKSSQINAEIIRENVVNYIPSDYQRLEDKIKTKIYLFNLEREELIKQVTDFDTYEVFYPSYSALVFSQLKSYIESLYFTPYTGRTIKIENNLCRFKNYPEIFKKDQQEKLITKLNLNLKQSFFKQCAIYKYNSLKYPIKEILIYHENRLIFSIQTRNSYLCGFIVIPLTINVDLCKTKIESHSQQYIFNKFLSGLMSNHSKYLPENYVDPTKRLFRE